VRNDELQQLLSQAKEHLKFLKQIGVDWYWNKSRKQDDKKIAMEALRQQVLNCHRCPLAQSRTNVVFGSGNIDAELMFVGEAPGYYEDQQGIPFVGAAGRLLDKILKAINLNRGQVFIGNILKCRPPENRDPLPAEIEQCHDYLLRQIELIKPKIICALGRFAAQTLLGSKIPISQLRGKFWDYQDIKLVATYHPAYLLRNPGQKRDVWEDMKMIRDFLRNRN
jgi:uracil-DNA glycosylase family 4